MISYEGFDDETTEKITDLIETSDQFESFNGYIEFIGKGRVIMDGHFTSEQLETVMEIIEAIEGRED